MAFLNGKTILVVDDEIELRNILSDEFKASKANVLVAENGEQALQLVAKNNVDAVVSDIKMPVVNGIELLDRLRSINPYRPIIILITGYSDITVEEAFHKGVDGLFSKPCDLDILVQTVHRALIPEKDRWVGNKSTVETKLNIELQLDSIHEAIDSKILSVGRGGMFVAVDVANVEVGVPVSFRINGVKDHLKFEGTGICRWVRSKNENNLQKGIGIEFHSMSESSFDSLSKIIAKLNPKTFIPISTD